ncbi:hypothetical protein FD755_019044 [Muntiacus reevesi]|uniref:Chromo domain-containing protein n=1 Tax=Muntiacus reevesi TaxID=9886 RepID=A0A5N3X778_MUNRE|nr:hypothetical protein FD755_019044 [Muntiacus reevesi]
MVPKQDPKPKFQQGERVLCFHGPLLSEAKCVKVAIKDKQDFLHYSGWNKNWDEWVPESRVLKYVDVNLQKRGELQKANQKTKTPGNGDGGSTSETPQSPCKKRARVDPTVENEATFMSRVEQKQLFYLPAKKNVYSILEDYYAVNEVGAGIQEYFSVVLGTQLLYKFERPQYAEILADRPDAPTPQVIGAMLAYTPLDKKSFALLLNNLHDFLKYLAKNSAILFSASNYEVAPSEYHRKAM